MKILLIGQNGQIAQALIDKLQNLGQIIACARNNINLIELDKIQNTIRKINPALIINAAAYTAVNKAEIEPTLAMRINGEALKIIAKEAQYIGAPIIHYSTDYVFDGIQSYPYDETTPTNPINVYGKSKLSGEKAIIRYCEIYWIFRISWIYSITGNNFLKTIIQLAQKQEKFTIINDQFGAPTWAARISAVTYQLLTQKNYYLKPSINLKHIRKTTGIYHLTAAGETSWHNYAKFIVQQLNIMNIPLKINNNSNIIAISSKNYYNYNSNLPKRPKNSRLACHKLAATFNIKMPTWQIDVITCLKKLYKYHNICP